MSHGPMTCNRAAELLLDYHDCTLDMDFREAVDAHLSSCATCRAMFATYKKTTSLCHKVMHATVPADIEDRLISFLRGHLGSKKPGKQP